MPYLCLINGPKEAEYQLHPVPANMRAKMATPTPGVEIICHHDTFLFGPPVSLLVLKRVDHRNFRILKMQRFIIKHSGARNRINLRVEFIKTKLSG